MKYDVVVAGAGAAGISCAWNCARAGLKTLLIEKNLHCGGLMTSGLVIPVMKLNSLNINTDFFEALINAASAQNACHTYSDGNRAWFNPEIIKSVFDSMLQDVSCDILYLVSTRDIAITDYGFSLDLITDVNLLSLRIDTKHLVDGTGDGKIFEKLNLEFLKDNSEKQSTSMRFLMSGVDCKKFADWICEIDSDRNVTTSCEVNGQTHFSTAYTWDTNRTWALKPYFEAAIADGTLVDTDSAYFQIFTVAGMKDAVAFNCPRLLPPQKPASDEAFELSQQIIEGRKRINRIAAFCNKYLNGFENAYVSNISDMLGVRETRRIKPKKVFTVADIESGIKPENIALASDYPIDVHSDKKDGGELKFTKHIWYLPLEALISEKYDNLFAVGRCLGAEFRAQAAVRTQMNCFSMGEAVAKHIASKING
ncbi:MAG: FAD-dependent oxidoreductase [Candidatus Gastranaerophilales bacterium]|nr:FAD-dependent oxidoreductase [Candidatus Gastranaerophilales bacterium]